MASCWHKLAHEEGEEAAFTEENKALVRRFVNEVQSAGNTDAIDEICSPESQPDLVVYFPKLVEGAFSEVYRWGIAPLLPRPSWLGLLI